MALFKIFRGTAASFLNSSSDVYKNAVDGYCYFVNDTGKFYIDIGTGNPEIYRKALNAECADRFYDNKTITFTGDMTGQIESDFGSAIEVATTVVKAKKVAHSIKLTCTDVNGNSRINTSFNGSAAKSFALTPEKLFPLTTITTKINLNANSGDWVDLGIEGSAIPSNGSYIIQVYVNDGGTTGETLEHYDEYYTGTFSWYKGQTSWGGAENADEIVLHKAGLSSGGNNLFLRTVHTAAGYLKMQAAYYRTTGTINTESILTIKVRQLI